MSPLNLYEVKMISGGKSSCEISVNCGVGGRRDPYVEAKITFKFGG